MSFVGDYFLKRHIKEQQARYYAQLNQGQGYTQQKFDDMALAIQDIREKVSKQDKKIEATFELPGSYKNYIIFLEEQIDNSKTNGKTQSSSKSASIK